MGEGVAFIRLERSNGTVLLQSSLTGLAGGNGLCWVETRDLDFGQPKRWKYVDAIELHIDGASEFQSAQLFYAIKDRIKDEIVWSAGLDLSDVDSPIYIRETARYFRFRISDFQPASRWKLSNISVYGHVVGGDL